MDLTPTCNTEGKENGECEKEKERSTAQGRNIV
jgi:hypothetical protein